MFRMSWQETKTKEVWPRDFWLLLGLEASLEPAFMGPCLLCTADWEPLWQLSKL